MRFRQRLVGSMTIVGFGAAATLVWLIVSGGSLSAATSDLVSAVRGLPLVFWAIAAVAVVVDLSPFPGLGVRRQLTAVFVSVCFTFSIALLWGPGPAIAVQTVAMIGAGWRLRLTPVWLLFTTVRLTTALLAAGLMLDVIGPAHLDLQPAEGRLGMPAIFAAVVTWFVVSYVILLAGLRIRHRAGWRRLVRLTFGHELLSASALLLLAPALVLAPSPWTILLLLVPFFAVRQIARLSSTYGEQARRDSLTGLLSRRGLFAELDERTVVEGERRPDAPYARFALLLLDLDRFKNVNDALGHAVGDHLLNEVARRLRATVRRDDLVARLGGDEFAIIAPSVSDTATAVELANHVGAALAEPAQVDGLPLDVSASIGVALCPDHGGDVATLMHHADVAMYEAKERRGTVAVYSRQADRTSPEQLELLADLRLALEEPDRRDEISFHYQPQVAIATGEVAGLEILLRWNHPERGLINPADAIRVAEHSSVMHLLTIRAFDNVLSQVAAWNADGFPLHVAVNVSVRDLHTTVLAEYLAVALRRSGVDPGQIEVEVTETAVMTDPDTVLANARALANLGVRLALDDFGTGYSSLQHLRRLPLSAVKIDRSFVASMATNTDDETIVRAVIQLSHALGLRVVAEGVDDDATHRMLANAGCDLGQGWYYAAAMPADELETWIAERRVDPVR